MSCLPPRVCAARCCSGLGSTPGLVPIAPISRSTQSASAKIGTKPAPTNCRCFHRRSRWVCSLHSARRWLSPKEPGAREPAQAARELGQMCYGMVLTVVVVTSRVYTRVDVLARRYPKRVRCLPESSAQACPLNGVEYPTYARRQVKGRGRGRGSSAPDGQYERPTTYSRSVTRTLAPKANCESAPRSERPVKRLSPPGPTPSRCVGRRSTSA
jgi:hypothetical protein